MSLLSAPILTGIGIYFSTLHHLSMRKNGVVEWLCIYVRHETTHLRFWRDEFSIVGSDGYPLPNLPTPKRADTQLFFGNRIDADLVGQSSGEHSIFGTKRTRNRH